MKRMVSGLLLAGWAAAFVYVGLNIPGVLFVFFLMPLLGGLIWWGSVRERGSQRG